MRSDHNVTKVTVDTDNALTMDPTINRPRHDPDDGLRRIPNRFCKFDYRVLSARNLKNGYVMSRVTVDISLVYGLSALPGIAALQYTPSRTWN